MNLQIIILAAGQGKRMYSDTPKVLHHLAGKPLLTHVVETAQQLNPDAIHVIYGHGGEQIKSSLPNLPVHWVHQAEQLGTGHAVLQAMPHIPDDAYVLVLSADVPLIQVGTLQSLIECSQRQNPDHSVLALLVAELENPSGLGRIIRNNQGEIYSIVEEKDANEQVKNIKEIYSGVCCTLANNLKKWLPQLSNSNAQGEYYLTEIISLAVQNKTPITSLTAKNSFEVQGINNRQQLQQLERIWQQRAANQLMEKGVTLADANRFDLRGELYCGKDVYIDINCIFTGKVVLGNGCKIGPNCSLTNVTLGDGCEVYANSVLEGCHIANDCHIGPFARLRSGTQLASHCKIGNFVETKKAIFDEGTKASHLSYLGDVLLGKNVNVGAGTITCNYDGVNKHQTIIEDGVFIGSDTQLVAPVTVGANATIGAGSTIRRNVPPDELTLTESRQKTIYGWKRPVKRERD
ncbi:TPA: bifunctional UDP-N-acetylglucosamine diphosphorylase/glucosamine-1-phosphate N-acetyltransferase GlmU [Legionella pneumophila]|uniref:bifunctional UDP-N-acetylglucosamine diphosphorylase/glucosamine-1-phosphate N-acetyltransferase GlmU n=1 Tax=Legionella pneumophila TaxID=446 RepID=UPI000487DB93|nr:bifunctional UDP-N-acetylglucosamine diphosphorylase/glucosamine-1-phosphate N-acetyltransferase GlmU [Legionella pneumophila]AMQ29251.1 bifunctional N-acetylglucosamine-1-phosphate uridyltransferase/glucosamine-1-phosphate acetyltransferase [Legionella pneumophila subsp. pneumophila]AMV15929.1 Bifunctional protein GlmU [Legionella pneumophila]ANN93893.1 UDP-N-acetylglucosamine diphosphorylase/glucosamine-1-phosphate N-acetyltransferase [Legionella pneumophila]MBN5928314.1 bifunctional UDP-N